MKTEIQTRGKIAENADYKKSVCEAVLATLPKKHVELAEKFYIASTSTFKRKGYQSSGGLACPSENEVLIREDCVNPNTIIHEIGHLVYYWLIRKVEDCKFWRKKFLEARKHKLNWFGGNSLKNDREFFANAYAHYYLRKGHFCRIDSNILVWLK